MGNLRVLIYHHEDPKPYVKSLQQKAPELELLVCETEREVEDLVDKADVLFVSTRFPSRHLAKGSRVRWIQTMGAGVERFTQGVALSPGTILTRVNAGFGDKIAEYVMAYMLAHAQRAAEVLRNQDRRHWAPLKLSWLRGQTLGVAGVGAIGVEVARRGGCLGMKVVGFDLEPKTIPFLDRCYGWSDFLEFVAIPRYLVICLPLTAGTRGLFGRGAFAAMRRDAVIINTARGPIICQDELVAALRAEEIQGAILDVFEEEPLPSDSPLWTMPNVVVTPHHSGPSVPEEMVGFFLANLVRFRQGQPLSGVVDLQRGF